VRTVHHERLTEVAAVEDRLHLAIGGVEAPHETDRDEPAPASLLGLHDPQSGVGRRGERLLAEDRLPCRDAGQDVRLVRRPMAADHHCVDVRARDELSRGGVCRRADPVGDRLSGGRVDVADRDDPAAGDDGVDAFDVGLPHTAGADHADPKSHRRVTLLLLLEAEAEGREVFAGRDGVGERVVLGAAIHVLLTDDIELLVEVGERLDELSSWAWATRAWSIALMWT